MKTFGQGSGSGKLILFGEHAVVYGQPAIAAGLSRGAQAIARRAVGSGSRICIIQDNKHTTQDSTLERALAMMLELFEFRGPVEVDVTVDLPLGAGLGSSAAIAVAVARALADLKGFELGEREDLVRRAVAGSEDLFHGKASGIDQAAALQGGMIWFQRHAATLVVESKSTAPVRVAICKPGPSASTAAMVAGVASLRSREPVLVEHINELIGQIASEAWAALGVADWTRVGELMNINHGALCALGVSAPQLDAACHTARDAGALGAKLTGAGGGGCVFALVPHGARDVLAAWEARGWQGFEVVL